MLHHDQPATPTERRRPRWPAMLPAAGMVVVAALSLLLTSGTRPCRWCRWGGRQRRRLG